MRTVALRFGVLCSGLSWVAPALAETPTDDEALGTTHDPLAEELEQASMLSSPRPGSGASPLRGRS